MTVDSEPQAPRLSVARLRPYLEQAGLAADCSALSCTLIGRFSNDVWRLDLDNGVRLIAKSPYRAAGSTDSDVERQFYRFINGERTDLPVPRYVAELDGILILEFVALQDFSFSQGVSADHAAAAIDALSVWHAAWWRKGSIAADWLVDYADSDYRDSIQSTYDEAWQRHRERLIRYAPEFEDLGDALVGRLKNTLAPLAEPATLIHGDAHAENIPLTAQGALLLDWQEPRLGNPGYDLAVFTTMSYRHRDRRAAEQGLVPRHANRLRQLGCDWADPWRDYRLGLLRRAARIVEIGGLDFVSLPWVFRRSALAAVEQGVGELIC